MDLEPDIMGGYVVQVLFHDHPQAMYTTWIYKGARPAYSHPLVRGRTVHR